jgi:hypothetical protein
VNVLRTLLLFVMLCPSVGRAVILHGSLKKFVLDARVIAHVEVISSVPEVPYQNPEFQIHCGHSVTAKVVEVLKGSVKDAIIRFGNSDEMKVGTQYLVALDTSKSFSGDNHFYFLTDSVTTMQQAQKLERSCLKRLPKLRAQWLFTSEFVGPKWVSWGFRVSMANVGADLHVIGRKEQYLIETFRYVDEDHDDVTSEVVTTSHPDYGQIVASEFSYPQLYVEWSGYRRLLHKTVSSR